MRRITVRIVRSKRDGVLLKWTDPHDGHLQRKAIGKTQRQIAKEARELEDDLNHRRSKLTWEDFVERYESSYLKEMSKGHKEKTAAMSQKVLDAATEARIKTLYCADVTVDLILGVEAAYRDSGVAKATVRSSMATLWAMLRWGMDAKLIPYFRRPRTPKGKAAKKAKSKSKKSKGRSLTMEEIERMTEKIPEVCKPYEHPEEFVRAMMAMRLIGLRLSDCWLFSWEPREGAHYPINLHGKTPRIFFCDAQKSGEEQEVPLTHHAVEWLRSIEKDSGWVCRTSGARGEHKTPNRLGRVIAAAGKASGIIVKATGGKRGKPKYASAHDLRRTFATSLFEILLTISEVQAMTRHADSQTLLDFYADAPIGPLMDKLRKYAERVQITSGGEGGGDDFDPDAANSQDSLQNAV